MHHVHDVRALIRSRQIFEHFESFWSRGTTVNMDLRNATFQFRI